MTDKDFVSYRADTGIKYPSKIKEGDGVKVGETVMVVVNRNSNTVKWIVNGVFSASETHYMLGDKDRQLFPFVFMYD